MTTRGDANATSEEWELDPDVTVGRLHLRIPWVGRWASRVGTAVPRDVVTVSVVLLAIVVVAAGRDHRRPAT